MKKLIVPFCFVVLFLLPFGCDSCDEYEGTIYTRSIEVVQGDFYLEETGPTSEFNEITHVTAPEHASFYQFEAIQGAAFAFFYRADTGYIGDDYFSITINAIEYPEQETERFYRYYVTVVADTSGS